MRVAPVSGSTSTSQTITPVGKDSILSANTASPSNGFQAASSNRPTRTVGANDLEGAVAINDVGRRRLRAVLRRGRGRAGSPRRRRAFGGRAADDGRGGAAGAAAVRDAARVTLADLYRAPAARRERRPGSGRTPSHGSWPGLWRADLRAISRSASTFTTTGLVGDAAGAMQVAGEAEPCAACRKPCSTPVWPQSPARRRP